MYNTEMTDMSTRRAKGLAESLGILTSDEVIQMLKISRKSLYRLMEEQDFPQPMRVGGIVRYDGDAIMKWFKNRCNPSQHSGIAGKAIVRNKECGAPILEMNNQIQIEAANIIANAVTGKEGGKLNSVYVAFTNNAVAPTVEDVPVSATVDYFLNLPELHDFIRVPIVIEPTIKDGAAEYHIVVGNGTGERGMAFNDTSWAYAMALVAEYKKQIAASKIFSWLNFKPPRKKSMDQLYINWSIDFSNR